MRATRANGSVNRERCPGRLAAERGEPVPATEQPHPVAHRPPRRDETEHSPEGGPYRLHPRTHLSKTTKLPNNNRDDRDSHSAESHQTERLWCWSRTLWTVNPGSSSSVELFALVPIKNSQSSRGQRSTRTDLYDTNQLRTIAVSPSFRHVGRLHELALGGRVAGPSRAGRSFRACAFSDAPLAPSGHP